MQVFTEARAQVVEVIKRSGVTVKERFRGITLVKWRKMYPDRDPKDRWFMSQFENLCLFEMLSFGGAGSFRFSFR